MNLRWMRRALSICQPSEKRERGVLQGDVCDIPLKAPEEWGLTLKVAFSASLVVAHLSKFGPKRLCGHQIRYLANLLRSQEPKSVSSQFKSLFHQVGFEFNELVI